MGCPSIPGIDIGIGGSNLQVSDGSGGGLLSMICEDVYGVIEELSVGVPTGSPGGVVGVSTASPTSAGSSEEGAPTYYPSYVPSVAPVAGVPVIPTAPTETTVCPDVYVPNIFYQPFDQVTNPNDDSSGTKIYECKDAPYTHWCSQAAYEPGVSILWSDAWSLVGECTTITATAPTSSPASTPTETTACPDSYVPNTFYQPFDQVTNPNDDSSGTKIYECKDAPYTPWSANYNIISPAGHRVSELCSIW